MGAKTYLVTGGAGFLGSALVHRLVRDGRRVRVLDNGFRAGLRRLSDVADEVEVIEGDVRDGDAVDRATSGVDVVCHLAAVNGTEFFYSMPEVVLEVAVRGMLNVLDAAVHRSVPELVVASSSEVYQMPEVPTDERVALSIPDPLNPRYSYAGGKLISELMALQYGRKHFARVMVLRPHNVYGPDMGWEHVIPQLTLRMHDLCRETREKVRLPIQGSGRETRAFVFIDDAVDGIQAVFERGDHLGIYNVGTEEEITIEALAAEIGRSFGREVEIVPGSRAPGSTVRRCPDITRLRQLGYRPRVSLREGLSRTVPWYRAHADERPRRTGGLDDHAAGA